MSAQGDAKGRSRTLLYILLAVLGVVVLAIASTIGGRLERSKRVMFIPGAGRLDPKTGMMAAGEEGIGAFGGGGRGGGMASRATGAPPGMDAPRAGAGAGGFQSAVASAAATSPMLIRTASLRMRVEQVREAHEEVARIAQEAKGYVADTTLSGEAGPMSASITIRVPAEGLDSVIDRITALGKLLHKQISTQEVTEEYVDLSSRRRNLEREEEQLLDLLKRAGKVKDLLEVEQTLARVRGQVETISGRMRYLENRVALSTVQVQLQGPEPKPTTGGPVWTARDVARQATRSLLNTGRGLGTMAIWIGVYTPVWLPLLLVAVWLIRRSSMSGGKVEAGGSS
jgi:hypothetical protein